MISTWINSFTGLRGDFEFGTDHWDWHRYLYWAQWVLPTLLIIAGLSFFDHLTNSSARFMGKGWQEKRSMWVRDPRFVLTLMGMWLLFFVVLAFLTVSGKL